jgi:hypothetical protein
MNLAKHLWWASMLWVALTGIIYFGTTLIALSQDLIPLEQYVREYFEKKKALEAWEAAQPKPKPTPTPLVPYISPFEKHEPLSIYDFNPFFRSQDYKPLYIDPKLAPTPTPTPSPTPEQLDKPKPFRYHPKKTWYT